MHENPVYAPLNKDVEDKEDSRSLLLDPSVDQSKQVPDILLGKPLLNVVDQNFWSGHSASLAGHQNVS